MQTRATRMGRFPCPRIFTQTKSTLGTPLGNTAVSCVYMPIFKVKPCMLMNNFVYSLGQSRSQVVSIWHQFHFEAPAIIMECHRGLSLDHPCSPYPLVQSQLLSGSMASPYISMLMTVGFPLGWCRRLQLLLDLSGVWLRLGRGFLLTDSSLMETSPWLSRFCLFEIQLSHFVLGDSKIVPSDIA